MCHVRFPAGISCRGARILLKIGNLKANILFRILEKRATMISFEQLYPISFLIINTDYRLHWMNKDRKKRKKTKGKVSNKETKRHFGRIILRHAIPFSLLFFFYLGFHFHQKMIYEWYNIDNDTIERKKKYFSVFYFQFFIFSIKGQFSFIQIIFMSFECTLLWMKI